MAGDGLRRGRSGRRVWAPACAALLFGAAAAPGVHADDTDVYVGRVPPPAAEPLIMISIDTASDMGASYAGCVNVGSGPTLCPPAQYFKSVCPGCTLPAPTQPLKVFDAVRFALRVALLQVSGIRVGLMLNHNHQRNCAGPQSGTSPASRCSNGGYLARGLKPVDHVTVPAIPPATSPTVLPGPNLAELLDILDQAPLRAAGTNHPYQGKELFFELFRYLTGQNVYNGHNGWTDYGTNNTQNLNQDNPSVDWDATAENGLGTAYVSPLLTSSVCTKIFTINFLATAPRRGDDDDDDEDDDDDDDDDAPPSYDNDSDAAIRSAAGGMTGIQLTGRNNRLSTVIGYLRDVDLARADLPFGTLPALDGMQNVTSYFFVQPTPLNSNPPRFDRKTTAYAAAGGTQSPMAIAQDPAKLVANIRSALTQIASISTTFVSASVPANVFDRTRVLDSVYTALFQPDVMARPFWPGNVKKLKLRVVEVACAPGDTSCRPGKEVRIFDALDTQAVALDGRIRNEALTFWTDPAHVAADASKGIIAGRDGRHVERGGAGQRIPGFVSGGPGLANSAPGARQLFFYAGVGTALTPLNADAATAALLHTALGADSTGTALNLLKYARGIDAYDADGDLNTTEVRPWLMGDPLHGRPLPINYGAWGGHTVENPAVFVAAPTNDGFLHFIRNTDTDGTPEHGGEVWAFLPVELLSIQDKLAQNNPTTKRSFGFDGAPSVYIVDQDGDGTVEAGDGDRVYLYVGFRRGGRIYYALDITDPLAPRFLWRLTPTDRTTATGSTPTADFAELGLTFSQPRIGTVQTGVNGAGAPVRKPAVFFAGGYDANKDYSDLVLASYRAGGVTLGSKGSDDTRGNAIFVVDALSGALLWKAVGPGSAAAAGTRVFVHARLTDSIPSNLSVVDTDSDGVIDRAVVGDTGGNVWRADFGGDADGDGVTTDDWKLTLLATLGRHVEPDPEDQLKADDRRFFHEPDYVLSKDELGPFDAIVIGSGDRADPLDYGRQRLALEAGLTDVLPENWIFVLKDRRIATYSADDSDPALVRTPAHLADVSTNCLQGGASETCNPDLSGGWRIRLGQGPGEKALAGPVTVAGRIFQTTYLPKEGTESLTCGPGEGSGLVYALMLQNGTAAYNYNLADGASPVGGANTAADRFEGLASAGIPTELVYISLADPAGGGDARCLLGSDLTCRAAPGATRFRTFWHRLE